MVYLKIDSTKTQPLGHCFLSETFKNIALRFSLSKVVVFNQPKLKIVSLPQRIEV